MKVFIALTMLFALLAGNEATPADEELICYTGDGRDYRGEVATTESGLTCQSWSSQTPYEHDTTPENYPDKGLDNNNYCRNPDLVAMPWCWTTDPEMPFEYCQVPKCGIPGVSCYIGDGKSFRGKVAKTVSGKTCQSWSAQKPQGHDRTPENYSGKGLDSNNYCRNPDGEKMPWCYTTDPEKRWEYCQIPRCEDVSCYSGDGRDYRGKVASTTSGKTCQSWSAQKPHRHDLTPGNYPDEGLNENYCRNPDGEEKPWCYTTDSEKRWEYCQVPRCDDLVNA